MYFYVYKYIATPCIIRYLYYYFVISIVLNSVQQLVDANPYE